MPEKHEGEGLSDKVRDAAEKVTEALEPSGFQGSGNPNNDASDPFTNDQRPDETGFPHRSAGGLD